MHLGAVQTESQQVALLVDHQGRHHFGQTRHLSLLVLLSAEQHFSSVSIVNRPGLGTDEGSRHFVDELLLLQDFWGTRAFFHLPKGELLVLGVRLISWLLGVVVGVRLLLVTVVGLGGLQIAVYIIIILILIWTFQLRLILLLLLTTYNIFLLLNMAHPSLRALLLKLLFLPTLLGHCSCVVFRVWFEVFLLVRLWSRWQHILRCLLFLIQRLLPLCHLLSFNWRLLLLNQLLLILGGVLLYND